MDKRTARIADKYIARDGGEPTRTRDARRDSDPMTAAWFIAHCPEDRLCGGITKKAALEALARLIDVPVAKLRALNPDC